MMSGLLQDWITFDGSGTASATQARGAWLDLAKWSDVTFWLEVRAVSNPGAGNVTLAYETAPTADESLFQPLASLTLAASSTPVITRVRLAEATVPLARWVRWKLEGTDSGNWSATFRVFATAGTAAARRAWAPTDASVPLAAWYRADLGVTAAGGLVSALADQSGQGDSNRDQTASGGDRPGLSVADSDFGGQDVLTGDGTQFMQSAGAWSAAIAAPVTVVVIGAGSGNCVFMSNGGGSWDSIVASATTGAEFYGAIGALDASVSVAGPSAIMLADDGTGAGDAAKLYVGNLATPLATGATNWAAYAGIDLVRNAGFVGFTHLNGKLAEVMVFAGVLTSTDVANLMTYLGTYALPIWTPASIASQLAMWLDPSDAANRTILSGKFSQLADKSGNGKTADQATSGLRPAVGTASINGLDTFRCTSSAAEYFDLQDLSALTAGEAFMVRVVSADPPAVLYGTWQLGGGVGNAIPYTDGYIYDDCGSTAQHGLAGSAAGAFTSPHVYSVIATSSEWTNFLNGTQLYTTATNTVGFSAAGKLGTDSRGYGTDGDFGEIIVCNQKLSALDRASMMTYLRAKWGTP